MHLSGVSEGIHTAYCEDFRSVANSGEYDRVCWGPLQTRKDTITRMRAFISPARGRGAQIMRRLRNVDRRIGSEPNTPISDTYHYGHRVSARAQQ